MTIEDIEGDYSLVWAPRKFDDFLKSPGKVHILVADDFLPTPYLACRSRPPRGCVTTEEAYARYGVRIPEVPTADDWPTCLGCQGYWHRRLEAAGVQVSPRSTFWEIEFEENAGMLPTGSHAKRVEFQEEVYGIIRNTDVFGHRSKASAIEQPVHKPAHWILQCNPARWRIFDSFETGRELTSWTITRYYDRVRPGDDIALWLTGPNGGVAALGMVTAPAEQIEPEDVDDEFWVEPEQVEAISWSLPIQLTREFLHQRVHPATLINDANFSTSSILRQPFAGNPFPLSDSEWAALVAAVELRDSANATRQADWLLRPGDTIRRTELHQRFGGSPRGGIAPSRTSPNVLIFTDPKSGNQHGYYDEWAEDGTFRYVGQGQRGDQTLTGGNRAILDHVQSERALRLFEGAGGIVRYVGEFVLDPNMPFSYATAHSTDNGADRQVIRFHLRPVVEAGSSQSRPRSTGIPYREADENAHVAPPRTRASADPDSFGRGLLNHRRLQNSLARLAEGAGYQILSPSAADPDYDLAWITPDGITVVEVKSITVSNEVRQLRMGLGQILDYVDMLRRRDLIVRPVLYVQRQPADERWVGLTDSVGVTLVWPGNEQLLDLTANGTR